MSCGLGRKERREPRLSGGSDRQASDGKGIVSHDQPGQASEEASNTDRLDSHEGSGERESLQERQRRS